MRRNEREISEIKEIEKIISKSDVCRIALANDNIPYMVTMNFGYSSISGKKIYFHCSLEGRKLEMIVKNNYVCFEFDTGHKLCEGKNACDFGMSYQSVVGWGRISLISDDDEKKEGLTTIMEHYTGRRDFSYKSRVFDRTLVLRLDIIEMAGKSCLSEK